MRELVSSVAPGRACPAPTRTGGHCRGEARLARGIVYRFAIDAPTPKIHRRNTLIKYHHKVPKTANAARGSADAN